MRIHRSLSWLVLVVLLITTISVAHAADINARIKGVVTDAQGSAVAGAQVTATNSDTGVKFTSVTSADGGYFFPQLPIGTYSISATAAGFKTFTANGIVLNIDQEFVQPVKLSVGAKGEVVEVSASPVQVNTTDMELSNVVNSEQMVELPLIGRTFTGLELIEPGVQGSSDRFSGAYSVSGAETQQSEYLINGADSNDIALNTLAIAPNLDAIDQFNLIDGPLNAEYDRNGGGIVSATIKQGSNHFHGDAFEFYRDTFMNTLGFYQKTFSSTGVETATVPAYHQNIFGGTIGGPVLKDKLFFFGAYQGVHQRVPDTSAPSVYSAANLAGNFSSDLGSFSSNVIPSSISIPGCTSGSQTWTSCLTGKGGVVPTSAFNTIAKNLLSYIPAPNSGTYGYNFNTGTTTTSSNQYIGRLDYSLNPKNQFTFLGIYFKSNVADALPFTGASLPGFGDLDIQTIQQYTFDYVHQFSASAVNDFAAHWTRFNYQAVIPQHVVAPSSVGFTGVNPENVAAASIPTISVSGNSVGFTLGFSTNGPQPRIDQVYQLDDSFSKTFGHHQFKFGYDGRRFNVSNPFSADNSGSYGFNNSSSAYTTGDGGLDFLLGVPATYAQGSGATIQADAFLNYVYAQDAWKLTNNFTLNYGLGYSIDTPLENHQYQGLGIACLTPGLQSSVFNTAPKGISYPGENGCTNSGMAYTRYNEYGPRVGFAWSPDLGELSGGPGKFAIRGGFGIYYNRTEEESSLQTLETPPFGLTSFGAGDFGGSPAFANPFTDINGGGSETVKFPYTFPAKGTAIPISSWANIFEPLDISTYNSTFRASYSENFQLSIEREFASRIVARVSYVGAMARHNQTTPEGNYETAAGHAACLAGSELSPVIGAKINCTSNRNLQSYYFPNNTFAGAVDPNTGNPGFVSIGEVASGASSSYNSLQASIQKGMTHGLTFQLSYTYAHALDSASSFENAGFGESSTRGFNQFQPSLNYGNSAYDVKHRLVFAPIYISPRSSGEWYSPVNLAFSGWEISGITTLATGFPFDISYAGSSSDSLWCTVDFNFYACPDVPNQVAAPSYSNLRTRLTTNGHSAYLSKTSFSNEVIGSFGNISRDHYHGPGTINTNMILAKNFPLGADNYRRLQLRMESDNVFNHTNFSNPGTTWSDTALTNANSTFGQVSSAASARITQLAVKIYF